AMSTKSKQLDETQGQIRQTLQVAESARAEGDAEKAARFETQAEQLANQLVTVEQDLENTRQLHGQATQAAEQAKHAVRESEQRLRETLAQEDQLLLQATQAEMQHQTVESMTSLEGSGGGNSPTFDEIRNKIEGRYTTALGKQELAEATGGPPAAHGGLAVSTVEESRETGQERLSAGDAGQGVTPTLAIDSCTSHPAADAAEGYQGGGSGSSEPTPPRDTRE